MLTPRQAWRKECKWCSNCTPDNCNTTICKLSTVFDFTSALQRIKAHCIECNGDDHPKDCTGKLIRPNGTDGDTCFLHPFRLGKNPRKAPIDPAKRVSMAEVFKKRIEKHGTGGQNPG